jgi:hypothetical protein
VSRLSQGVASAFGWNTAKSRTARIAARRWYN